MSIAKDSLSINAMGGTELMKNGLLTRVDPALLEDFQIFVSRVEEELDPTKIRILWLHDLPGDPASHHLKDGGHTKFHKLVFTSNWQMQAYINFYQIPWSKCIVLQNAIEPIPNDMDKWGEKFIGAKDVRTNIKTIKLIYTPTPHRGLALLVPVFNKLCKDYDNLELDVYSSFKLYGWEERDKQFEPIYEQCRQHLKINYHGSQPNDVVREALQKAHIFAYPSTWPETSCLSLIEAMSAGCLCVHSNYAALPETAANWTYMYHFNEDQNAHANTFYSVLRTAVEDIKTDRESVLNRLYTQKSYVDLFYSWCNRAAQWTAFLNMMKNAVKDRSISEGTFVYRS